MGEEFVDVPGLEGLIAVSKSGRVMRRSRKAGKWHLEEKELKVQSVPVRGWRRGKPYQYRTKKVILTVGGKIKGYSLNSLLRKTFGAEKAVLTSPARREQPVGPGAIRVEPKGESRSVIGYPGYRVFENGAVTGMHGEVLVQRPGASGGYMTVQLRKNGKAAGRTVHTLVLEAFSGPRPQGFHACHGIGGALDNSVANLRWDTVQANAADRVAMGKLRKLGLL